MKRVITEICDSRLRGLLQGVTERSSRGTPRRDFQGQLTFKRWWCLKGGLQGPLHVRGTLKGIQGMTLRSNFKKRLKKVIKDMKGLKGL